MVATQRWDPEQYARAAAFVPLLGAPLLDLLAPKPGERVLDLGCGNGTLTAEIAALGAEVVGVDASPEMVSAARARGLDARVMDGTALTFCEAFDAVFSNAAMHWMLDLGAVCEGVYRALRPGGRFVGELGGEGNCDPVRRALHAALERRGLDARKIDPWIFPTEEAFSHLLKKAGFRIARLERFVRPTALPGDIGEWLLTFAGAFLATAPEDGRDALVDEIRRELEAGLKREDGSWWMDYVRIRFIADKPTAE